MVTEARRVTADWQYDVITIGYPGPVRGGHPVAEPHNLAAGWVGFDFTKAFARPVRMVNDAAMQALGDYRGGHMLFLGLGTGLGSALIVDGVLAPLELAHLPYKHDRTYESFVGLGGLKRLGRKKWEKCVGRGAAVQGRAAGRRGRTRRRQRRAAEGAAPGQPTGREQSGVRRRVPALGGACDARAGGNVT